MKLPAIRILTIVSTLVFLATAPQAWAASAGVTRFANKASDSLVPFVVLAELSLATEGEYAKPEMVQGAKALLATTVFTYALKYSLPVRRPNGESKGAFPSGHTSAAFAMATVVADYEPRYKWLAYGAASTMGWSRVEVRWHRWNEVLAGAALGYFTAKHFTDQPFVVTPDGTVGYQWKW